jgi:hypothetical protein
VSELPAFRLIFCVIFYKVILFSWESRGKSIYLKAKENAKKHALSGKARTVMLSAKNV